MKPHQIVVAAVVVAAMHVGNCVQIALRRPCHILFGNEPFDILSDESAEIIENNAEIILEEIGIDFRDDPEALTILRDVGCDVQGERVHFPRGLARSYVARRRPAIPTCA
ncbi:MAG: hypothetical protein CM15mP46_5420 [Alphaproteobacteria bacterium]|nr:MAG: hypothetical protein CM15mP46_5420 [Alphaproteobacteria bacterium]